MVFIGGPRQVGKTTLSKKLGKEYESSQYFNWDNGADRRAIKNHQWRNETQLIIFDELHKFSRWKNWIKGVYDTKPINQQYLVTGSARLDVYKRGGDSLLGRYHYWRLHPLTLDELPSKISAAEAYRRLLTVGGFPEPFFANDEREARRWHRERFDRILREDIRDLEQIRQLDMLSFFIDALRERVGSTITLANIARDLELSPHTVKHWLALMQRMYIGFAILPLTEKISRAILKPPKVYFYDNADVIEKNNSDLRLENLVAAHLLKRLNFIEDYYGYRCSLNYIRDKDGREVDFAVTINNELTDLIEVKATDTAISSALKYYKNKLQPKNTTQIVGDLKNSYHSDRILITNPIEFFVNPPWEGVKD